MFGVLWFEDLPLVVVSVPTERLAGDLAPATSSRASPGVLLSSSGADGDTSPHTDVSSPSRVLRRPDLNGLYRSSYGPFLTLWGSPTHLSSYSELELNLPPRPGTCCYYSLLNIYLLHPPLSDARL